MKYLSETEKLLLRKAQEIEAADTSGSLDDSLEWLQHFNTTMLEDSDAMLLDAFFESLVTLDKNFHVSRKSRYKDEKVHEWKSFFRQKYNTFGGGYTIWRVVFRDPNIDMDGRDMAEDIYFTPTLQVDIIDSAKRIVEHVTGTSMKDLCVKALSKVVSMFKLDSNLLKEC